MRSDVQGSLAELSEKQKESQAASSTDSDAIVQKSASSRYYSDHYGVRARLPRFL